VWLDVKSLQHAETSSRGDQEVDEFDLDRSKSFIKVLVVRSKQKINMRPSPLSDQQTTKTVQESYLIILLSEA
jgi:hypothetical protein